MSDRDRDGEESGLAATSAPTKADGNETPVGLESQMALARARSRLLGADPIPVQVGRYVVVERLGSGAMGLVLRGYDPKLRREVALKVVRTRARDAEGKAEARLLREAQALARLSHPNVVAVYDAEKAEGGVCIAMEYVEGRTLRDWLAEEPRSWREILEVGLAIARGLAAAHAVGLVHRDVKPDNVLVGVDGRVRVTDFGLARSAWTPSSGSAISASISGSSEDETLTGAGTVLGTPAYLAPEQHTDATADERTDQYALGVLMWEALHGTRPYHGGRFEVLAAAKRRGPPARPRDEVPAWLHAIVARSLAVEPTERWPSIAELAHAFASGRGRVRRKRALLAGVAVIVGGAGVLGWHRLAEERARQACRDRAAEADEAWNPQIEARLVSRFEGTGLPYAQTTLDAMVERTDWYVETWQAARTDVCLGAEVDRALSPDLYASAIVCLDDRRDGLAALLDVLAEGGGESLQRATGSVYGLPGVEPCTDPDALRRRPHGPESDELRARSRTLRRELQRANGLANAARYDESVALAQEVSRSAAAAGLDSLELEALVASGGAAEFAGRYDEAEGWLRGALVEAGRRGFDEVAADAATRLVATVGSSLARHGEGLAYADTAEILVSRVEPSGAGPRHMRLLDNLGAVRAGLGELEEAERIYGEALEMARAELGDRHPAIGIQLGNLASVVQSRGDNQRAIQLYAESVEILDATLGPNHPDVAVFSSNLAVIHLVRGDPSTAVPLLERALAIQEAALGPDHVDLGWTLTNLGAALHLANDDAQARVVLQRALAIREGLGPNHPSTATTLIHLAAVLEAEGETEAAEDTAARSLKIYEQSVGPEHPALVRPLVEVGRLGLARGEVASAIELLERAATLSSAAEVRPDQRGDARSALASALWAAQRHEEARARATEARADYEQAGDAGRENLDLLDRWLAEHDE